MPIGLLGKSDTTGPSVSAKFCRPENWSGADHRSIAAVIVERTEVLRMGTGEKNLVSTGATSAAMSIQDPMSSQVQGVELRCGRLGLHFKKRSRRAANERSMLACKDDRERRIG